jgi:hypothetical protein
MVPVNDDVLSLAGNLHDRWYTFVHIPDGIRLADPWGTEVRVRSGR